MSTEGFQTILRAHVPSFLKRFLNSLLTEILMAKNCLVCHYESVPVCMYAVSDN